MGKKVCENIDIKRELLYSFSTLVFTPILYYFAVTSAFNLTDTGGGGNGPATASVLSPSPQVDDGSVTSSVSQQDHEKVGGGRGDDSATITNDTMAPASATDPVINFILEHRELPFETVFYVVAFEVLKLLIVFTIFPGSHLFDQTPSLQTMWNLSGVGGNSGSSGLIGPGGGNCSSGKGSSQGRLPFSKRDNVILKSQPLQIKILEIWKGFCNYTAGCVICHVFVVLLGAPIIEDCKITFQFSVILTTWLLFPLCLAVQPSRLLQELMFISLWNSENEILHRTKWKFAAVVFGAWAGAIVIPLDWDRPWQRWPIPLLTSTIFTVITSNLVVTVHLFCTVFGIYHKIYMISTESNKIKNF